MLRVDGDGDDVQLVDGEPEADEAEDALLREAAEVEHAAQGGEAETNTPAQFTAQLRSEIKKWAQVIKASAMQLE